MAAQADAPGFGAAGVVCGGLLPLDDGPKRVQLLPDAVDVPEVGYAAPRKVK